jgi:hypothetical protein
VFQPGWCSVFDLLVRLAEQGKITLDWHYDPTMDAHGWCTSPPTSASLAAQNTWSGTTVHGESSRSAI